MKHGSEIKCFPIFAEEETELAVGAKFTNLKSGRRKVCDILVQKPRYFFELTLQINGVVFNQRNRKVLRSAIK